MKRRFLRGASLALAALALAGSSLSYYSKEIRLQLFGTNQERAIAEIEGLAGSYKIDETLPGKPIVKVDLSFSEIDVDCIRIVGNLPHLRYLSLLETSVTDDDIVPLGALTELRWLNLMSTHIRALGRRSSTTDSGATNQCTSRLAPPSGCCSGRSPRKLPKSSQGWPPRSSKEWRSCRAQCQVTP